MTFRIIGLVLVLFLVFLLFVVLGFLHVSPFFFWAQPPSPISGPWPKHTLAHLAYGQAGPIGFETTRPNEGPTPLQGRFSNSHGPFSSHVCTHNSGLASSHSPVSPRSHAPTDKPHAPVEHHTLNQSHHPMQSPVRPVSSYTPGVSMTHARGFQTSSCHGRDSRHLLSCSCTIVTSPVSLLHKPAGPNRFCPLHLQAA